MIGSLRGWTHFRPLLTTRRWILRSIILAVNTNIRENLKFSGAWIPQTNLLFAYRSSGVVKELRFLQERIYQRGIPPVTFDQVSVSN